MRRRLTNSTFFCAVSLRRRPPFDALNASTEKTTKHVIDDDDCVRSIRPASGIRARSVDAGRGDEDAKKRSTGGGVERFFSERLFIRDDDSGVSRAGALERKVRANVGDA